MTTVVDPYATGVLDKEVHERLVANLDGYAMDAGIHKRWVWTPVAETCGPTEIAYLKAFNQHRAEGDLDGFCYVMNAEGSVEDRMQAMAGVLLRNFIRARVMTVDTVLELCAEGDYPDCTALLIPNFFVGSAMAGGKKAAALAAWRVRSLYDLLLRRQTGGRQTIIAVSNLEEMAKEYGHAMRSTIEKRFQILQV